MYLGCIEVSADSNINWIFYEFLKLLQKPQVAQNLIECLYLFTSCIVSQ